MIIAIDIGNTNVVVGISDQDKWPYLWRWHTELKDAEAYHALQFSNQLLESGIKIEDVGDIVISSVVPDLKEIYENIVVSIFGKDPIFLDSDIYKYLSIQIDRPTEIGSDLVANAMAAHHKYGGNRIVVDFGTALTFTTVNEHGEILGVAIAPGLKTSIAALFNKTAQLPEVPLELPKSVVGKNTIHAIQSGVLHGYVGLVRHQLKLINDEMEEHYSCIATGGLSSILLPLENDFDVIDPNLTLEGLKYVAELFG